MVGERKRGRPGGEVEKRDNRVLRAMFAAGASWGQMEKVTGLSKNATIARVMLLLEEADKQRPETPEEAYLREQNDFKVVEAMTDQE